MIASILATVAQSAETVERIDTPGVDWWALAPILVMIGGAMVLLVLDALSLKKAGPTVHTLFTVVVAVLTSMLFGLAPALRATRQDLTDSLKDGAGGASSGGGRQRFRNGLVVAERAIAFALLVGAGLLVKNLLLLTARDAGIRTDRIVSFVRSISLCFAG